MAEESTQAELDLDTTAAKDSGNDPVEETKPGDEGSGSDEKAAQTVDWRSGIEDEKLRKHAERFNSPGDLVKGHFDLRQKLSKAFVKPGKDATEEDVASFRKAFDIPVTADEYVFSTLPEKDKLNDEQKQSLGKWSKLFHDNNVPKSAADSIVKEYQAEVTAILQAKKEADEDYAKETESGLKKAWGKDYEVNFKYADQAVRELFGGDLPDVKKIETADGKFVMDHPAFVKVFAHIGRQMQEGVLDIELNDEDRGSLMEQADEFRAKRNDAMKKGDMEAANRYDEKESEVLAKIHGKKGVVGAGGRTA